MARYNHCFILYKNNIYLILQVVVAWSNSIEDSAGAARILSARGALEAGVRWAARGGRWGRALDLCRAGAPHLEGPVRAQMAAQLEDQGKVLLNQKFFFYMVVAQ